MWENLWKNTFIARFKTTSDIIATLKATGVSTQRNNWCKEAIKKKHKVGKCHMKLGGLWKVWSKQCGLSRSEALRITRRELAWCAGTISPWQGRAYLAPRPMYYPDGVPYKNRMLTSKMDKTKQEFTTLDVNGQTEKGERCTVRYAVRLSTCNGCQCKYGLVQYETQTKLLRGGKACTLWAMSAVTFLGNFFGDYRLQEMKKKNNCLAHQSAIFGGTNGHGGAGHGSR